MAIKKKVEESSAKRTTPSEANADARERAEDPSAGERASKVSIRQSLAEVRRMIAFHRGLRALEDALANAAGIEGHMQELTVQRDNLQTNIARMKDNQANIDRELKTAQARYTEELAKMKERLASERVEAQKNFDVERADHANRLRALKDDYRNAKVGFDERLGDLRKQTENSENKLNELQKKRDTFFKSLEKHQKELSDG